MNMYLKDDNLSQKSTFIGWPPFIEDNLKWKVTMKALDHEPYTLNT